MGDLPAVASGEGWVLPMSDGLIQTHGQDARASASRSSLEVAQASSLLYRQSGDAPKRQKLQRLQLTAENPFSTFNLSFPFWPRLGLPR